MINYIELKSEQNEEMSLEDLQAVVRLNEDAFHNINIDEGKWQESNMSKLCTRIKVWRVPESLWLNGNYEPEIINDICHIQFPVLKTLFLSGNDIFSVESLYRLQAPFLKHLYLYDNLISIADSFRKIHFPSLTNLKLEGNPIPNIDIMSSTGFSTLRTLSLENNSQQSQMGVSIKWIIKTNVLRIGNIFYRKNKRIEEKNVESKIKQKFKEKLSKFVYIPNFGDND